MTVVAKNDVWNVVDAVLGVARVFLLYGPPGTGKSYAAHASSLGERELYTVTLTQDTAAVELRGHLWPTVGKGGAQVFEWHDGPAIAAWRNGGRLVINEINHAGGDCLSFLMNVLDSEETAAITLPTGETLRPHPDFQCIATMNGNPDEDLPEAMRDRFPAAIEIIEAHPNGINALPKDLQDAARGSVMASGDRRITLRAWLAYAKYRESLGDEIAAFTVFGTRAQDILNSLRIAG